LVRKAVVATATLVVAGVLAACGGAGGGATPGPAQQAAGGGGSAAGVSSQAAAGGAAPSPPASAGAAACQPQIKILAPQDGASVTGGTVTVRVQVDGFKLVAPGGAVVPCEGHLHYWVDGQRVAATNETTYEARLTPGQHQITASLQDNQHHALNPPVEQSVTVNVR
jgi:hypothetical protein